MPEQDQNETKLDHSEEVLGMVLVADPEATKVIQPGKQSLVNRNLLAKSAVIRDFAARLPSESGEQRTVTQLENAAYWVGVISFGIRPTDLQRVGKLLRDDGYTLGFLAPQNTRAAWIAPRPTVFYYSDQSQQRAKDLAQ